MDKKNNKIHVVKRVTSIDVARLAGVSQPTVSRTFSNPEKVPEETREKVFIAAKHLGYKPNAIARSLTSRRTDIIGIIVPNPPTSYHSALLNTFTTKLQNKGLQILLFNVAPDKELDDILFRVLQYQVDGLVITAATISSKMADECADNGTPVVLFNRYVLGAHVNAISCDNVEGGRMVANYLLDTGHKRFAYIGGALKASTNIDRQKGFIDRLRERGITEVVVEQGKYSYEYGREATKTVLSVKNPPDAIFCSADAMALGAMDAARFDLGLNVPDDVSIVGFDDIKEASWPSYSLTTVRQPTDMMVDAAIELLEKRNGSILSEPVFRLFDVELIKRNSVGTRW